ncbi:Proton-dependent oligopeptide transporter family [Trema orientale]|uniref:Proton-dependent oligopeptide transporter family n=1 Tax=Trema orientale TaxID=63057 RepID=A0A2P5CRL5_TREOI|nr:Proton-dependent oligopeptide transporter family [Trema orientale]
MSGCEIGFTAVFPPRYNDQSPTEGIFIVDLHLGGRRQLEVARRGDIGRFFDKAAVVETSMDRTSEGLTNAWRLCTITQVEELKSIIRLRPIWACGIVFATVFSQMSAMFILQGNKMDPHMGPNFKIPSASLSFFNALGVIIDQFLVPFAAKFTGREH